MTLTTNVPTACKNDVGREFQTDGAAVLKERLPKDVLDTGFQLNAGGPGFEQQHML